MSSPLPTIDQNTLAWIITGGIIGLFITIVTVAVKIERRISRLEGRIEKLEDNPFFVAVKEYEVAQMKKILNPEDMLKRWEEEKRDKLSEGGQNTT